MNSLYIHTVNLSGARKYMKLGLNGSNSYLIERFRKNDQRIQLPSQSMQ